MRITFLSSKYGILSTHLWTAATLEGEHLEYKAHSALIFAGEAH